MPISKSAKKSLRVSRRKTSVNRYRKALIKEALKSVDEKNINKAFSMVDKAAKWGIYHPNKAARVKSKLSKQLGSSPAEKPAKTATKAKPAAKKATAKKSASTKKSTKS